MKRSNFISLSQSFCRIALLRVEEQKAMGKINETQARAKEILEIKRRNESNLQERFSHTLQVIFKFVFHQLSFSIYFSTVTFTLVILKG
jgi:hypothetical protein